MVALKGAMSKTSFTSTSRDRNNSTAMRAMGIFMIMYIVSNLKRIIDGFHNRLESNRIGESNMYNYFILIYFSISFCFFIYLFFTFFNANVVIPSIMEVGKILNTLKILKHVHVVLDILSFMDNFPHLPLYFFFFTHLNTMTRTPRPSPLYVLPFFFLHLNTRTRTKHVLFFYKLYVWHTK